MGKARGGVTYYLAGGHSRLKNGVAPLPYVPDIPITRDTVPP
jgi:hypothetical protein